jgi:hypothetical protein
MVIRNCFFALQTAAEHGSYAINIIHAKLAFIIFISLMLLNAITN